MTYNQSRIGNQLEFWASAVKSILKINAIIFFKYGTNRLRVLIHRTKICPPLNFRSTGGGFLNPPAYRRVKLNLRFWSNFRGERCLVWLLEGYITIFLSLGLYSFYRVTLLSRIFKDFMFVLRKIGFVVIIGCVST